MKAKSVFWATIIMMSLFLLPGCGEMTSLEINHPEHIKGIVADGPWDITVYQSETPNAYLDYKDSYDVTAEVRSDGYLHLKVKHRYLRPNLRKDLQVVVEIPYIEHIKASGACRISINGKFEGDHCKIDLNGASEVKHFEFYGKSLDLDLDGASECSMSGKVNHVKISGSGASDIRMFNLTTETLDINLSGASDAEITVNERITGKLTGASSLKYRGNADRSDVKTSGASDIKKK
jgi:Protein of unknown function (DUF2807).